MTLLEIVKVAREGQPFMKQSCQAITLQFMNGVLVDQVGNPPVFCREDFTDDDWEFVE